MKLIQPTVFMILSAELFRRVVFTKVVDPDLRKVLDPGLRKFLDPGLPKILDLEKTSRKNPAADPT